MPVTAPYLRVLFSILVLCGGCAHNTEEHFFIPSASLAEDWRHIRLGEASSASLSLDQREFVVTGHRLIAGQGTVLAIRRFTSGSPFLTDQASFEKLTVALSKTVKRPAEEFVTGGGESVLAFYSFGSSNFPGAAGCFGYARQGNIRIVKYTSERITAHLTLLFPLASPGGWKKECSEKRIDQEFEFTVKSFDQLTTWDGKAGRHIYDETMHK